MRLLNWRLATYLAPDVMALTIALAAWSVVMLSEPGGRRSADPGLFLKYSDCT